MFHNFGELKVTALIAKNSVRPAKMAIPKLVIVGDSMSSSRKALSDGALVSCEAGEGSCRDGVGF